MSRVHPFAVRIPRAFQLTQTDRTDSAQDARDDASASVAHLDKRSGRSRGDPERVEAARRQAALALGRDPDQRDPFIEPPKSGTSSTPKTTESISPPLVSRSIGVLSVGEAADPAVTLGRPKRPTECCAPDSRQLL
jgi:hypothetical protein